MDEAFRRAIEAALGASVRATAAVHGGDVAISYRVDLDDGRRVFAKTHASPPAFFFSTEASGLEWLGEAKAVAVPAVLAVSDDAPAHLVLEWIDEGRARPGTDPELGAALAALHLSGAPCFGRLDRRTTGSRALPNDPSDTWADFYARCRLLPLACLAREGGALAPDTIAKLETVAARLDGFAPPPTRRPACTVICGPATGSWTRPVATG